MGRLVSMKSRALNKKELQLITDINKSKYAVVFALMYELGLRHSELKRLDTTKLLANGAVYIKSSKGSDNQLRNVSKNLLAKLRIVGLQKLNRLIGVTRHGLNKALKTLLNSDFGISTHSLRKSIAQAVYSATKDIMAVCKLLRHKTVTSTQYYIQSLFDVDSLVFSVLDTSALE